MTPDELVATYLIERLGSAHDRKGFACQKEPLARYLREQARKDAERFVAATFVAVPRAESRFVAGYYSLSSASIDAGDLPPDLAKRLPRYGSLPATLLGRLAVDDRHRGRGLGEFLLMHALAKSLSQAAQIGSFAMVVDAIDEEARRFYEHYEFLSFPDQRLKLYLPTASTVARLSG